MIVHFGVLNNRVAYTFTPSDITPLGFYQLSLRRAQKLWLTATYFSSFDITLYGQWDFRRLCRFLLVLDIISEVPILVTSLSWTSSPNVILCFSIYFLNLHIAMSLPYLLWASFIFCSFFASCASLVLYTSSNNIALICLIHYNSCFFISFYLKIPQFWRAPLTYYIQKFSSILFYSTTL